MAQHSDSLGLIELLLKSFIWLPLMLAGFILLLSMTAAKWMLPLASAFFVSTRDYTFALYAAIAWMLIFLIYRTFRLGEFYAKPDSYL